MKRTLLLAIPALLLFGCPVKHKPVTAVTPMAKTATPAPTAMVMAHTAQEVLLSEPGNPVVSIRIAFRTGSVDDPKGKEGLTALTAALMAEGGTKSYSSSDLIQALYPMAAELDAQVDREMTVFTGRVHRDNLEKFLPILAEVVLSPRMDAKEFDRMKVDAINDLTLRLRTSDDENLGKAALETMLAPNGHPYAHPAVGTESGLKALTLQDAIAHRGVVFGQARMILGVAGGYDPDILAKFRAQISSLPMGQPPIVVAAPEAAKDRNVLIVEKPAQSVAVSIGFDYDVTRADPDSYRLRVAMSYFGEHRQMIGDLMQTIREKRGMNYGDYAYGEKFVQEGGSRFSVTNIPRHHQQFSMWLRPVQPENAVFAVRAALWRYDDLLGAGLSKEDFESTRSYLMGYTRLWDQTTDRRLGWAIDNLWYGTPAYLEGFRSAMKTMTAEDVNAAVKKHLAARALQIAIITGDAKKLSDAILAGKPTPPVYTSPKPPEIVKQDKEHIEAMPLGVDAAHVKIVPTGAMFQ